MIHRSARPDVAVPDIGLAPFMLAGLRGREDEPALIDGLSDSVMSRRALTDAARRFAGGLAARGLGPGSVIALMAPNCPEFAVAFLGAAIAGATLTTVNPTYTAQELRHHLDDSGARLLVVPPVLAPLATEAIAGSRVAEIVHLPGEGGGAHSWERFLDAAPADPAPLDPAKAVAVLPYSSGTTGLPKGVMLTHRNLVANALQTNACLDVGPGETTLAILPFFHIYGMQVLMTLHLAHGAALVTLPRFDLAQALRLIERHRVRRLYVAPPVVLALAKHPLVDSHDVSSLELIISGAAPLGVELTRACAERLGCEVAQAYGMTEASPVTHFSRARGTPPGAAGELIPNTEARLLDPETGRDAAPGAEGELLVRGPQVMAGYLNNPQATARTVDAEGWLHTGDLARIDPEGHLHIVDRVKELIKVRGFQVAPAELEAALLGHPAIADCAVVGRPDDETGETPVAFVVLRPGAALTEAEALAHVAARLARYKVPTALRFVEAIPKSASGKILRRLLREQA